MAPCTFHHAIKWLLYGCIASHVLKKAQGIAPRWSWETVMPFFHSCNETGLWSDEALDVISKFPMVTVEKGQGFLSNSSGYAEDHIITQLAAVKARDPTIQTVFYMNSVLNWFFYALAKEYENIPAYWLYDSTTHKPVRSKGDRAFQPQPSEGMLVFNHAIPAVRSLWKDVCYNAVNSGVVDGCFADSSFPDSKHTYTHLNASDRAAFEAGKVITNADITRKFGGEPGKPYPQNATGVLIGKRPDQKGINAIQIEDFEANEEHIQILLEAVAHGYLVQVHVSLKVEYSVTCGCSCITNELAAFLIGMGKYSYFGYGTWISPNLADVKSRWCPDFFTRPLGKPLGSSTRYANGIWRRSFSLGTNVTFDAHTNKGTIDWSGPSTEVEMTTRP
mmetsp:Transcript_55665/g.82812  ORF Transcript_55665/g.82812 Transcript_55665/m.82812 type:complete len:390 (+) Transcript_55665:68-1237(+)